MPSKGPRLFRVVTFFNALTGKQPRLACDIYKEKPTRGRQIYYWPREGVSPRASLGLDCFFPLLYLGAIKVRRS